MWKLIILSILVVLVAIWFLQPFRSEQLETIQGKRVLVTGASTGLGEQIAYKYAEHGASVVITARRKTELDRVAKQCRSLGPSNATYIGIPADMSDDNSLQSLVEKAIHQLGGLDILVLNHINKYHIEFFDGGEESRKIAHETMHINFRSYVEMTALTLPYLTKSGGNIVIINSLYGRIPAPKQAAYSASKYGLNGFFSSLRSQFIMEGRNVAITSCYLGSINTPNARQALTKFNLPKIMKLPAAAADVTARKVVVAGARRDVEMIHPPEVRPSLFLYNFFPWIIDAFFRHVSESES